MPKRKDDGMALLRREGQIEVWGNAVWDHPWLMRNVECPDGKRRTVYLSPYADTSFSWPGRVKIQGRWIKGFVSDPATYLGETESKFTAQHNGHMDHRNDVTADSCSACWLQERIDR